MTTIQEEVERYLIAMALVWPERTGALRSIITAADFKDPRNAEIFEAIVAIARVGRFPDPVLVRHYLLSKYGGREPKPFMDTGTTLFGYMSLLLDHPPRLTEDTSLVLCITRLLRNRGAEPHRRNAAKAITKPTRSKKNTKPNKTTKSAKHERPRPRS